VHVYEQSGEKYKVFLPKTYKELQQAFSEDMPAVYAKLVRAQAKGAQFGQTSEVWEVLAMQALDRCEYVLAGEFLSEAIAKSPGKAKLLHLLAEVYALLQREPQARSCAEQAYEANPQSSELRNLLLQVAPEVWADKLRHLSATTNARSNNDAAEDGDFAGEIAEAYAPPSHSRGAKSAVESGPGSPTPAAAGAGAGAGRGAVAAPPATSAYLSAEVEPVAEENSSWLSKMKTKASGALKVRTLNKAAKAFGFITVQ
jgi:tetratricopeptide (TPR) repeat protein